MPLYANAREHHDSRAFTLAFLIVNFYKPDSER